MPTPRTALTMTLAAAGIALAAAPPALADDTPTTVTIGANHLVASAGESSPNDFPGVKLARHGKPLPKGYSVYGRDVSITRGTESATGTALLSCPSGKTIASIGGQNGVVADPFDRTAKYIGKRRYDFTAGYSLKSAGDTLSGTMLVLCK